MHLYKFLTFTLLITFSTNIQGQCKRGLSKKAQNSLDYHNAFLKQQEVMDRELGSEAEIQTTRYIANNFEKIGLKPVFKDSYLQPVPLVSMRLAQNNCNLKIGKKVYTLFQDYYPLVRSSDRASFKGDAIQVNEGMIKDKYTDATMLVRGNCALIQYDVADFEDDIDENYYLDKRINLALSEGVKAIIFYSKQKNIKPSGDLLRFSSLENIPIVFVNEDLSELKTEKIEIETDILSLKSDMNNIVGMVNNQAQKTVLIATHIDNDYYENKNRLPEYPEDAVLDILYTEDISTLLTLADLVQQNSKNFKNYNYVFAVLAGSKNGNLGAEILLNESKKLNFDWHYMININDLKLSQENGQLLITGLGTSKEWPSIIEKWLTAKNKFYIIQTENGAISNSDHLIFYQARIPVLQFTTFMDHTFISSNLDKNTAFFTTTLFQFLKSLEKQNKFTFTPVADALYKGKEKEQLGIEIDYLHKKEGVKIFGFKENSWALENQLKLDDVILDINGKRINSISHYFELLEKTTLISSLKINRNNTIETLVFPKK